MAAESDKAGGFQNLGIALRHAGRYREAIALAREAREQVSPTSRGGTMSLRVRVPTEIFLFIKRYIPDFGESVADIGLLCSVWPDLKVRD